MKKLEVDEMARIGGGKASPEFIIMCGIMSAALGTLTFGLGLLSGVACVVLGA
jgi:hypothetical protein